MNPSEHVDKLIRKLESLADLSDEEKQALHGLPMTYSFPVSQNRRL